MMGNDGCLGCVFCLPYIDDHICQCEASALYGEVVSDNSSCVEYQRSEAAKASRDEDEAHG